MSHFSERQRAALAEAVTRLTAAEGPDQATITPAALVRLVALADSPQAADLALACRLGLQELARRRPGKSGELRVPPYAAVQLGGGTELGPGAGPSHTRGTPPAVVECDPATFVALAAGQIGYREALANHRLRASGAHSDLAALFPL